MLLTEILTPTTSLNMAYMSAAEDRTGEVLTLRTIETRDVDILINQADRPSLFHIEINKNDYSKAEYDAVAIALLRYHY